MSSVKLVRELRKRIKYRNMEEVEQKGLDYKKLNALLNNFLKYLDEYHEKYRGNSGYMMFQPTENMLAWFCGFSSWALMKKWVESTEPEQRALKPACPDEIKTMLAIFHEINASSAGMSAAWLRRHFPMIWARDPDGTEMPGLDIQSDGSGGVRVKIIKDYRGREDEQD